METKINIAESLKGKPQDTHLYLVSAHFVLYEKTQKTSVLRNTMAKKRILTLRGYIML